MKQTAAEKFEQEFFSYAELYPYFSEEDKWVITEREFLELIEKFKVIEKAQHNETWDSAHQAGRFEGKGIAEENWQTFETHWEENFKSK